MDQEEKKDAYSGLDAGSPHMAPEDYVKAGLGPFEQDPSVAAAHPQEPTEEDGRVKELVRRHLEQNQLVDASRIEVDVLRGHVRLHGTAENRYSRHRAEELAREIEGVQEVLNKIAIQPSSEELSEVGKPVLSVHEPGTNTSGSTQRS